VNKTVTRSEINGKIIKQVSLTSACPMPNSYDEKNFASNRLIKRLGIDTACR